MNRGANCVLQNSERTAAAWMPRNTKQVERKTHGRTPIQGEKREDKGEKRGMGERGDAQTRHLHTSSTRSTVPTPRATHTFRAEGSGCATDSSHGSTSARPTIHTAVEETHTPTRNALHNRHMAPRHGRDAGRTLSVSSQSRGAQERVRVSHTTTVTVTVSQGHNGG